MVNESNPDVTEKIEADIKKLSAQLNPFDFDRVNIAIRQAYLTGRHSISLHRHQSSNIAIEPFDTGRYYDKGYDDGYSVGYDHGYLDAKAAIGYNE